MARNATMEDHGYLYNCKYLIHDRDGKYCGSGFLGVMRDAGVKTVPISRRAPNMNAYAERFVRSIKEECVRHFIPFSPSMAKRIIQEYIEYYNKERPHQGVGNRLLLNDETRKDLASRKGPVQKKERLGGLLNYYYKMSV